MQKSKLENKTLEELLQMKSNREEMRVALLKSNLPSIQRMQELQKITRSIEQIKAKLNEENQ